MGATSLQHQQLADNEAKMLNQVSSIDQIQVPSDILPEEKQQITYNVIFKLVKKKKGRFYLDNCCNGVMNPKTKNSERIWLLSGARSIWDSELEYILKDKERYDRARRNMDVKFIDGICMVPATDTLRIEFLRSHVSNVGKRRNGSGKFDFYEYDFEQEQKDRHAKQVMKLEMVVLAEKMSDEDAKKLASFLGVPLVDEVGFPKSPKGIKTELMLKADTDPATFQKYVNAEEVKVSWLVKRAILDTKIDLASDKNVITAMWANGKGFIARFPDTQKPYQYLTNLALDPSNESGKKFLEQLKTIVT